MVAPRPSRPSNSFCSFFENPLTHQNKGGQNSLHLYDPSHIRPNQSIQGRAKYQLVGSILRDQRSSSSFNSFK
jgi:hypothetical protein